MQLSDKEFKLISDTDFLLTKVEVLSKIEKLLVDVRSEIEVSTSSTDYKFPNNIDRVTGKISRGENYRNLPYMVLDYPSYFQKENILAFRTMFWWGNFFSCTLHLQGIYLDENRDKLCNNIDKLERTGVFISIGKSPWQYHYEPDNYVLLNKSHAGHIQTSDFIKLSWRLELDKWGKLPMLAKEYLNMILQIISISN